MRIIISSAIVSALLTTMSSGAAQQTPASLFNHLAGTWVLRGTIQNQKTIHDVDAAPVLNGGYMRLHEVSREKDAHGGPAYEAIVFISQDQKTGQFACLWLDTTSNAGLAPGSTMGRGTAAANQIDFLFKNSADIFHTTFVYNPGADSWEWLMDDEKDGKLQPFARVTLTRK
jgi:hypothetical protein